MYIPHTYCFAWSLFRLAGWANRFSIDHRPSVQAKLAFSADPTHVPLCLLIAAALGRLSLFCLKSGKETISTPTSSWGYVGAAYRRWPLLLHESFQLSSRCVCVSPPGYFGLTIIGMKNFVVVPAKYLLSCWSKGASWTMYRPHIRKRRSRLIKGSFIKWNHLELA